MIAELDITYGHALADSKFHRIQGDLNTGNAQQAFIWTRECGKGEAILTDIQIIPEGSSIPEGYNKVSKKIGTNWIVFKREENVTYGIKELRISFDDEIIETEGFEKINENVNATASKKCYFWIKRGEFEEPKADSNGVEPINLEKLQVGDVLECFDRFESWSVATVANITDYAFEIHFNGWSSKFNEIISKEETQKFARIGTHTNGKMSYISQGGIWKYTTEDLELQWKKLQEYLNGEADDQNAIAYLKGQFIMFIETTLSSNLKDVINVRAVADFCKNVIAEIMQHLETAENPYLEVLPILKILLGLDTNSGWFFRTYTHYDIEIRDLFQIPNPVLSTEFMPFQYGNENDHSFNHGHESKTMDYNDTNDMKDKESDDFWNQGGSDMRGGGWNTSLDSVDDDMPELVPTANPNIDVINPFGADFPDFDYDDVSNPVPSQPVLEKSTTFASTTTEETVLSGSSSFDNNSAPFEGQTISPSATTATVNPVSIPMTDENNQNVEEDNTNMTNDTIGENDENEINADDIEIDVEIEEEFPTMDNNNNEEEEKEEEAMDDEQQQQQEQEEQTHENNDSPDFATFENKVIDFPDFKAVFFEYFISMGGFDVLMTIVKAGKLSLNDLSGILKIIAGGASPNSKFTQEMMDTHFEDMRGIVLHRMSDLSDDELRNNGKDELMEIVKALGKVLEANDLNTVKVDELCETYQLELALRMLVCPALAKRVEGLTLIQEMIKMISRKTKPSKTYSSSGYGSNYSSYNSMYGGTYGPSYSNYYSNYYSKPKPIAKWMTNQRLTEWIQSVDLPDYMFGAKAQECGLHQGMLKKCQRICEFMAEHGVVTHEHIAMLWESGGKSKDLLHTINTIVSKMLPSLSYETQKECFERATQVPLECFDENSLSLLQAFADVENESENTAITVQMDEETKNLGFRALAQKFLWEATSPESSLPENLREQAETSLVALLKPSNKEEKLQLKGLFEEELVKIKHATINNEPMIQTTRNITRCQQLMQAIMRNDRINFLREFTAEPHNLLHVLIDNVSRCIEEKDIEFRLDFLKLIVTEGMNVNFDFESLKKLKNSLKAHQGLICAFIRHVRFESKYANTVHEGFEDHTAKQLLELLQQDIELKYPVSMQWLRLYKSLTIHKMKLDRLITAPSYSKQQGVVSSKDLSTYPAVVSLWKLLRHCDTEMAEKVSKFLIQLATRVSGMADKKMIWCAFVEQALKEARECREAEVENEEAIFKIVSVISQFFDSIEIPNGRNVSSHDVKRGETFLIVRNKDAYGYYSNKSKKSSAPSQLNFVVPKTSTLAHLRELVARALKTTGQYIELSTYMNKKFTCQFDNVKTIQELGISQTLSFRKLNKPSKDTVHHRSCKLRQSLEELDAIKKAPRMLLTLKENSSLLFELLASNHQPLAQCVWDLLSALSVDRTRSHNMETLGGTLGNQSFEDIFNAIETEDTKKVDWCSLFHNSSKPCMLLYDLTLCARLIGIGEEDGSSVSPLNACAANSYCKQFIEMGGLEFFIGLLCNYPLSLKVDSLAMRGLVLLLDITLHLLEIRDEFEEDVFETVPAAKKVIASKNVVFHMMDLIYTYATKETEIEIEGSEGLLKLLGGAWRFICLLTTQNKESECDIITHPNANDIILTCLIYSKCEPLRESTVAALRHLIEEKPEIVKFLHGLLLPELRHAEEIASKPGCQDYFSLLPRILQSVHSSGSSSTTEVDLVGHAESVLEMIMNRPMVEKTADDCDQLLVGLLNCLTALVTACPGLKQVCYELGIISHLFHKCLFADAATGGPLCKNTETRKNAFVLLARIGAGNVEASKGFLSECIDHHHLIQTTPKFVKKKTASAYDRRSATGYAGLKNLGCICYLNASLQQLFNVEEFRDGVLAYNEENCSTAEEQKESFMYQLQKMFVHLRDTDRKAYNPKDFCYAFKDWEGNPTNVAVQQDASEFLSMFFQKVESSVQGSPVSDLLKRCFGGTVSSELVAADGKHYSERIDPFTFVSVSVKGKKSLEEGLKGYIAADDVSYKWEKVDGETEELPTKKSSTFLELPDHLIVHLKRFEFDLETLDQIKVDDRYAFPRELNMKDFCKEGIPGEKRGTVLNKGDEYYQYKLHGIVVHMGSAHFGHYYSYIRNRDGSEDPGKWCEFNDERVSAFDPTDVEAETYGGDDEVLNRAYTTYNYASAASSGVYQDKMQKSHSAFLLIYDRVAPQMEKTELAVGASAQTFVDELHSENQFLWHRQNILDPDYFSTMYHVLGMTIPPKITDEIDPILLGNACRLALNVTLGSFSQCDLDTHRSFSKWVQLSCDLLMNHPESAIDVLDEIMQSSQNLSKLCENIFSTLESEFTEGACQVLGMILKMCALDSTPNCDENLDDALEYIIRMIPSTASKKAFLLLVNDLAEDGNICGRFLQMGILDVVMKILRKDPVSANNQAMDDDFYGVDANYNYRDIYSTSVDDSYVSSSSRGWTNSSRSRFAKNTSVVGAREMPLFLRLLATLVEHTIPEESSNEMEEWPAPNQRVPSFPLSAHSIEMFSSKKTLVAVLEQMNDSKEAVCRLLTHLLWKNPEAQETFISSLLSSIKTSTEKNVADIIGSGVTAALSVDGTMLDALMEKLVFVMEKNSNYYRWTETAMSAFLLLAENNESVLHWIWDHDTLIQWMGDWLYKNPKEPSMYSHGPMKVTKPGQTRQAQSYNYSFRAYQSPHRPDLVRDIDALLNHLEPGYEGYGHNICGQHIEVEYREDDVYRGEVQQYDPIRRTHEIHFYNGESEWLNLQKFNFRFINSEEHDEGEGADNTDNDMLFDNRQEEEHNYGFDDM
eukprot:TRINITY_DN4923_c0_g1_i1.p1 TRINITY_DN4923_c0_g1~~TRINITY_DN4923_c0_g1_i1.p1  ORF type:complete len:2806 (-),score=917.65 TRINITY_DN4923_c0_g1_i1:204-8621(-)